MTIATNLPPQPPAPVAEQWLLASDDDARRQTLQQQLQASNQPLTAWRLRHGRVRLIPCASLHDAVAEALGAGAALVHVHAELSAAQLLRLADSAAAPGQATRVLRHPGTLAASPDLLQALADPDTLVALALDYHGLRAAQPIQVPGYGPEAAQAHAQALDQWAQASGYAGPVPDEDLDDQDLADDDQAPGSGQGTDDSAATAGPSWRSLGLPLMLEGQIVASVAAARGPQMAGMLQASPVASPILWREQLKWHGDGQAGAPGPAAGLRFTACLLGQGLNPRALLALKLALTLPRAAAAGLRDVQVWLYPKLGDVVRLRLGDACDGAQVRDETRLEQVLRDTTGPAQRQSLLQALAGTRIVVSADPALPAATPP